MSIKALFKDRINRMYGWGAVFAVLIQLLAFKLYYPCPNIIFDSYYYIKAAALDQHVNAWPIGYSIFLRLIGFFTHAHLAVVCFQYLFVEISFIYFFFTWRHIFRPGKAISILLFFVLFLNPLFLFISNFILSDSIFVGLSVGWISQLLWVVYRPRPYMVFTSAILLLMAFTVRYNALYYPFIGSLAFLLSRQPLPLKASGILLPLVLTGCFILYTSHSIGVLTGKPQFSPFGGWKLANDALYAYAHVPAPKDTLMPNEFRVLDLIVQHYFIAPDTLDPSGNLLVDDASFGSFYMFNDGTPLVDYMHWAYGRAYPYFNSKRWMLVSPLFQEYGFYLIRKYPQYFFRYFICPNFIRYCTPPSEALESPGAFAFHESYGAPTVRKWFGIDAITFKESHIKLFLAIMRFYPSFFTLVHLFFFIGLTGFLICGGFKKTDRRLSYCLLVLVALWLTDLIFSISAAGVVLRYQIFMMVVEVGAGIYFIDHSYKYLDRSSR